MILPSATNADACWLVDVQRLLWLQQSILEMEVSDLLADSGDDVVDDCCQMSQTDAARPDADTETQFIPDSSNVPSLSHDAGAPQPDAQPTNVETAVADSDPDIFMYVALCLAVLVVVSAFYAQVLNK